MKVLISGSNGQLGYALQKTAPSHNVLGEPIHVNALTRADFDLSQPQSLRAVLNRIKPDVIINAAAYTAVDKAEADADVARTVNADAVAILAQWCNEQQAQLIQVSTDFIFEGTASTPYLPSATTNPLSVYGATKLQGEAAAHAHAPAAYIVRTGWVYCEHGANFVKTMLRLGAERDQLGVVCDQVGTPTYAINLAAMIWRLIEVQPKEKIWHYSDAGVASWYDFAQAIFDEAYSMQLLDKKPLVKPIPSSAYPTPAQRPNFSVLNKEQTWVGLALTPIHWRSALVQMLHAYKNLQKS